MDMRSWVSRCHAYAHMNGFYKGDCCAFPFVCEHLSGSTTAQIMLIVSELGEAVEALRCNDPENFEEEIADTFIRLFDLCGAKGIRHIEKVIEGKMKVNESRDYRHDKAF